MWRAPFCTYRDSWQTFGNLHSVPRHASCLADVHVQLFFSNHVKFTTMKDAESLILAVEKYPCLWNIHDKAYHNRDAKDLAWEQVCEEVIADWNTCTRVDKENKSADIKKKWTHMRDYFRRHYQKNQNAPAGSAAKKVKKYVYADLLYFLIPVFDGRHTEGNYETNDSENTLQGETKIKEELSFMRVDDQTSIVDDHTSIMEHPSPVATILITPRNSNRKKKDISTQTLHMLHLNANENRQEVEDDDTKFLLSFRTHMKHMNTNQKIDFKLGMLQLVKKNNTESYSHSPPNYDPLQ